ncbi:MULTISPECIES: hypothetical protein [unclassified Corallococcus]|uniref:hypothetical protein n=1 Tax=unclassified Corallococcus TaxID=2685029 RepID=UPI001A902BB3|nr:MULTISPECIES: hypothetical protein [unclassified Corallococcus]MBN9683924.1 hypothetical protein [Corallococcus sp. NCSPR001]WAS84576.1 hypothetical protein O0N60_35570 [Corallococcus sp. NCRR]
MIALLGVVSPAVRGLRVRVGANGSLLLVSYFSEVPQRWEVELLSDAVAEAAFTLGNIRLQPQVRCVVVLAALMGVVGLDDFEEREFGNSVFSYWQYLRYGEFPCDVGEGGGEGRLVSGEYVLIDVG